MKPDRQLLAIILNLIVICGMENKKQSYIVHPRVKADLFRDQQEHDSFIAVITEQLQTIFDEVTYCPDPYESWLTIFITTAGDKNKASQGGYYIRVCTFITEDILTQYRSGNLLVVLQPHLDLYRIQFSESNPRLYNSR